MSVRAQVWSIGLALSFLLAIALSVSDSTRELSLPLGILAIAVTAVIAESFPLRDLILGRELRAQPAGARPADGLVEVASIPAVAGTVNPLDPRYRRFVGLENFEGKLLGSAASESPRGPSPLLGRVAIFSVFVGRDGMPWSDPEIAASHLALEQAGIWIEEQAIRYEAPINLQLAEVYFQCDLADSDPIEVEFQPEGDDVGPLEANASIKAVVMASRAAAGLGFADVSDWMARINARIEADSTAWLFLIRQAGRSLAIPREDSGIPGVGFAVCYAKEASFPEPLVGGRGRVDPTTVAHELLHLFGASDKYGVTLKSFPPGSVTPRDVMRLNHSSLGRMAIDRLTATEIGWPGSSHGEGITKKPARRTPSEKEAAGG